eukprot:908560-Rhodomonas_salina.1
MPWLPGFGALFTCAARTRECVCHLSDSANVACRARTQPFREYICVVLLVPFPAVGAGQRRTAAAGLPG